MKTLKLLLGWPLLIAVFLLASVIIGFIRMTIDLGLENATDAFARLLGVE